MWPCLQIHVPCISSPPSTFVCFEPFPIISVSLLSHHLGKWDQLSSIGLNKKEHWPLLMILNHWIKPPQTGIGWVKVRSIPIHGWVWSNRITKGGPHCDYWNQHYDNYLHLIRKLHEYRYLHQDTGIQISESKKIGIVESPQYINLFK